MTSQTEIKAVDLEALASKGGKILKLAKMGHPILASKTQEIDPQSPEALQVMRDMAATIIDISRGVQGLAAPQIHIDKRVMYYQMSQQKSDSDTVIPPTFLINPYYENVGDETYEDWEVCFSLIDLMGLVPRHRKIKLRATKTDGTTFQEIEEVVEGHHARVLAHEIDHLDGILYTRRMTDMTTLGYREEILKYRV